MKKIIISTVLIAILTSLVACANEVGNTTQSPETEASEVVTTEATTQSEPTEITEQPLQQQPNSFEIVGMPAPFDENRWGRDSWIVAFDVPTDTSGDWCLGTFPDWLINLVNPNNMSMGSDCFVHQWAMNDRFFTDKPATNLSDYPNIFTFIKHFDVPLDEVARVFEEHRLRSIEHGWNFFTDEEIELILSLDEDALMQHFVSDHAIYHEGAIYTPMWFYWHAPEKYAEVGITPEMVEEHLEILAEFEFTEEADEAFSEKLSEFIGEEVSLREIRNRRRGNHNIPYQELPHWPD
ncbi:MAG: hypothetical protein FWF76_01050 [Oscillospiraceae bacterium]|nr:hypothetical protein [Oscillospiraceae bacterium]